MATERRGAIDHSLIFLTMALPRNFHRSCKSGIFKNATFCSTQTTRRSPLFFVIVSQTETPSKNITLKTIIKLKETVTNGAELVCFFAAPLSFELTPGISRILAVIVSTQGLSAIVWSLLRSSLPVSFDWVSCTSSPANSNRTCVEFRPQATIFEHIQSICWNATIQFLFFDCSHGHSSKESK